MLVVIACLLASAAAAPAIRYNQRQDGEMNVRADVQNVVFIVAIPSKLPFSLSVLDGLFKNAKGHGDHEPELQERADVHSMESFIEPSTPYRVEISSEGLGTPAPDVKAVIGNRYITDEVVIAGRRNNNKNVEADLGDGLKLLGATEQCGPGRARDAEGVCREVPEKEPEEVDNSANKLPKDKKKADEVIVPKKINKPVEKKAA